MFGGTVVMALLGLAVQIVIDKKKKKKYGWDESSHLLGRKSVNY